ncbi:MAG: hypothetical protein K6F55_07835 [Eubacterium sp.]|nr:hypothetical protein [Eubacterium sp.]
MINQHNCFTKKIICAFLAMAVTFCVFAVAPMKDVNAAENVNPAGTNISIETAAPYTFGKKITGEFTQDKLHDYYILNVKKNGFVTYTVDSQLFNHAFYIYNKNKTLIHMEGKIEAGNNSYKIFLAKGKYFI